jgi:hypothetical protein
VGGEEDNKLPDTNLRWRKTRSTSGCVTRIHVKAGPRVVGVAFIRKNSAESVEPLQPFTRDLDAEHERDPAHRARADRGTVRRPVRATRRAGGRSSCAVLRAAGFVKADPRNVKGPPELR